MEIPANNYNYITEYVEARDELVNGLSYEKPEPFRLVMIKCKDFCQFCTNPSGDVYSHWISMDYRFGFLSCDECIKIGEAAVIDWFNTKAYGPANHLRKIQVKITRSSGAIESDWVLDQDNPFVEIVEGSSCVHVVKTDDSVSKWVKVDDLVKLNK